MWALLLCSLPFLVGSDPYSFPWTAGDIQFTCTNLGEGWVQAGASCFYVWKGSLLQWRQAQDICNSSFLHYSSSTLLDNWLIARSLQTKIEQQPYWTGFVTTKNDSTLLRFPESLETSIYDPLWADNQPPARNVSESCVGLDMSTSDVGWRLYNCNSHLPVLCETFACLPNEFRCLDNSRCIPSMAVGDGITDCEDNSDENDKTFVSFGRSSARANECFHIQHSNGGEISSPGYPSNYHEFSNCLWNLRTTNDKVIAFTVSNISLTPNDILLIEGNDKNDVLSFSSFNPSLSYLSKSSILRIQFVSNGWYTAKGFRLNYVFTDLNPCSVKDDLIAYDSSKMPFDCTYDVAAPLQHQYILLLAEKVYTSRFATVSTSYKDGSFGFRNSNHSQAVVLTDNMASVRINDAWRDSDTNTFVYIRVFYLDRVSTLVQFSGPGLTLHWPKVNEGGQYFQHSVSFEVQRPNDNFTWSVDRIQLNGQDRAELLMNSSSYGLLQPGSFHGSKTSIVNIVQTSTEFTISVKFSIDSVRCVLPRIPNGYPINISSSEFRPGTILNFGCETAYLPFETQSVCEFNGIWNPEPVCYEVVCPELEDHYRHANKYNETGTHYNDVGFYRAPTSVYPTSSFRICTAKNQPFWMDTGFNFIEKVCVAYPVLYGKFPQPFFPNKAEVKLDCLTGFGQTKTLSCANGKWDNEHLNCTNLSYDDNLCGPHGSVVTQLGGYSCICDSGYISKGFPNTTCQDVDECTTNLNVCDADAFCENTEGNYNCICPPGKRLWNGNTSLVDNSTFLVPNKSCIENDVKCNVSSLPLLTRKWYIESSRQTFSVNEQVNLYCSRSGYGNRTMFVQFLAVCQEDGWTYGPDPCLAKCSLSEWGLTLKSATGSEPHLFETVNATCTAPGQIMIGSNRLMCGYEALYEKLPVCVYPHCSNITEFAAHHGFSFYSSNPDDPFSLGSELFISAKANYTCHPINIKCVPSVGSPIWNSTLECVQKRILKLDPTTPSNLPTYVNLLDRSVDWIRTNDWNVGFSTISLFQKHEISFLISPAIELKSDFLHLTVTASSLSGQLSAAIHTGNTNFLPALLEYSTIGSLSAPGTLNLPLKHLKKFISISLQTTGPVVISSIFLTYTVCAPATVKNIVFPAGYEQSSPQYIPVVCIGSNTKTRVLAECSSKGWKYSYSEDPCYPSSRSKRSLPFLVPTTFASLVPRNTSLTKSTRVTSSSTRPMSGSSTTKWTTHTYASHVPTSDVPYVTESHSSSTEQTASSVRSTVPSGSTEYTTQKTLATTTSIATSFPSESSTNAVASSMSTTHSVFTTSPLLPRTQRQTTDLITTPQSISIGNCSLNACSNGMCVSDIYSNYQCHCLPGFKETKNNISECRPNNAEFTFCSKLGGNMINDRCVCKAGYAGWSCNQHVSGCSPCTAGSCQIVINAFSDGTIEECVCTVGQQIMIPCSAPLVDDFLSPQLHNPCNHGRLVNISVSSHPVCECEEGYLGQTCSANVLCLMDDHVTPLCQNGGICEIVDELPVCHCTPEWSGLFCNETINSCLHPIAMGCGNGQCVSMFGRYVCLCNEGWTGPTCDVEIGCPQENPCVNGGCVAYLNSGVLCNCSEGYTGEYCDNLISLGCNNDNLCGSHGRCVERLDGSFYCECESGYRSSENGECSELVTYCSLNPCLNGGTCEEGNSLGYNCTCTTGYTGSICETKINLCDGFDCGNGTCHEIENRPKCQCNEGWTGEACHTKITNYCMSLVCKNGGTCIEGTNSAHCECDDNHTGSNCQYSTLNCSELNCHSGQCRTHSNNGTYCSCWAGYSGEFCEHKLNCADLNYTCENGGTCSVIVIDSTLQQKCSCVIGTSGPRCQNLGESCEVVKCENGGTCVDDQTLNAYCICTEQYTGETCETKRSFSYNLMFNGVQSPQRIVSKMLNTSLYREFTLCSWVIYAPSKPVKADEILSPFISIITESEQMVVLVDNKGVLLDSNRFIEVTIPTMGWHHVCIRSPEFYSLDRYVWSYYLDGSLVSNATNSLLPQNSHTLYLIELDPRQTFEGELGLTQFYTSRLTDKDIAEMAFQCTRWTSGHPDLLINWQDFTRVERWNPGIKVIYPGICDSSDCLPGRPSCNTTDKIPPIVLNCPDVIQVVSSSRLTVVDSWDTSNMFSDNVGIASVKSNFRPGQAFAWGYYRVVIIASDKAGNTANCIFNIIVSPSECPTTDDSKLGGSVKKLDVNGIDTQLAAFVTCDDKLYPTENPKFFLCDAMGQWDRTSLTTSSTYSFPACGWTIPPQQNINGSLTTLGVCQEIRDNLENTLYSNLKNYCLQNCTNQIKVEPDCSGRTKRSVGSYTFNYQVVLNDTREMVAASLDSQIKSKFPDGKTSNLAEYHCDQNHPLTSQTDNYFSCGDCPAGNFWNVSLTSCMPCPPDTYRSSSKDAIDHCTSCPVNTTTGGAVRVTNVNNCYEICDVGSFFNKSSQSCSKCAQGTYQDRKGQTTCIGCPIYTSTSIVGATSELDCSYTCDPGTEFDPSGIHCTPCHKGSYKTTSLGACIICPIGLTTNDVQSKFAADCEVVNCPPNYYINPAISYPVNNTTPFESLCFTCKMGTYQPNWNETKCITCPSYDEELASTCVLSSQCSPQLSDSCAPNQACKSVGNRVGVYSCLDVQVSPKKTSNAAIVWSVVGVAIIIIIIVSVVILWTFRDKIFFCKRLKRQQNHDFYRSPGFPREQRRRNDVISIASSSKVSTIMSEEEHRTITRTVVRSLPPPIITSRTELEKLEKDGQLKAVPRLPLNRSHVQFPRFSTNRSVRSFSSDGTALETDDDNYFA